MGGRKTSARREPAVSASPQDDDSSDGRAKPARRRKRAGTMFMRLFYWTIVLGIWAVIAGIGTIAFVASTLPPIQSLQVPKRPPTIEIVGLDGRPLTSRGEMSGTDISIKELPPYLPRAFIAIEDRRFYSHYGVDPIG